ncbi:MAG: DUF4363 family protein [Clostridia bacterium]|nr:DUF4363 family protein [Clostridia bacterium]
MKRGISALIILAIVFSLSFAFTSIITVKAEKVLNLAKDVYSRSAEPEELEKAWEKESIWFSFFINHNLLEPIASRIYELKYISSEDRRENCAQIITGINEIKDHISLSLYTVF